MRAEKSDNLVDRTLHIARDRRVAEVAARHPSVRHVVELYAPTRGLHALQRAEPRATLTVLGWVVLGRQKQQRRLHAGEQRGRIAAKHALLERERRMCDRAAAQRQLGKELCVGERVSDRASAPAKTEQTDGRDATALDQCARGGEHTRTQHVLPREVAQVGVKL